MQDGRWWLELMVDSATMSQSHGKGRVHCIIIILIKSSSPPSIHCRKRDIGWEGSYIPVYIHAHDQRIRLEAADYELRHAICISVTINLWWEET